MASRPDPKLLGERIAKLRRSRGLNRKQVVDRIGTYYSDETALGRVERGERLADRDRIIAILATGISVTQAEINDALALVEYAPLTAEEVRNLGTTLKPAPIESPIQPPKIGFLNQFLQTILTSRIRIGLGIWILVSGVIVAGIQPDAIAVAITALLYGALYAVSVFLEGAFAGELRLVMPGAAAVFCLMLSTSVIALAIDARMVKTGNLAALSVSLVIFFGAAIAQWFVARLALPSVVVVPSRIQTMTAQAAHLKNTLYFLVIVVVFWLPSFHGVMVLRRELSLGHTAFVRQMLANWLMIGRGIICLNPGFLWGASGILVLVSLPMGARLLENLRSHAKQNTYTILLFVRAALYFVLILVCLLWYSSEIGALTQQVQL